MQKCITCGFCGSDSAFGRETARESENERERDWGSGKERERARERDRDEVWLRKEVLKTESEGITLAW